MIIKYKKEFITVLVLFLVLLWIFYLRLINTSMIEGNYILIYHECDQKLVELPTRDDNLTLYENHKFRSSFWGSGEYRLEYGVFTTKLVLINSGNTVENELSVIRKNSKIVIMLDNLCDQYYEKED